MKTVSASRRRGQETQQSRIFQATMTAILFNRNRYAFCVSFVTYTAVSLTWKLHGCQFELGIAEKKGILSGESAVGLLLLVVSVKFSAAFTSLSLESIRVFSFANEQGRNKHDGGFYIGIHCCNDVTPSPACSSPL